MANHVNDATLLDRFVNDHEEAAFAMLVQRHGPRVLAACRRIVRNEHDAEDVFQATFLVLARRAAEVAWREEVGGWLCGVAYRLSRHARARRNRREVRMAVLAGTGVDAGPLGVALAEDDHPSIDPLAEIARRELRRVLDDELSLLPEKYRAPVVLCYLEGMTNEEAARQLGWPAGSMSRRLQRARTLLKRRLAGRGLPLALIVLCGALAAIWPHASDRSADHAAIPPRGFIAAFPRDGHEADALDLQRLLARISQENRSEPDRDDILRAARQAAQLAAQLDEYDPGQDRTRWRSFADALQASARRMAHAVDADDVPDLLAAVRQANTSCVQCHLAFRQ